MKKLLTVAWACPLIQHFSTAWTSPLTGPEHLVTGTKMFDLKNYFADKTGWDQLQGPCIIVCMLNNLEFLLGIFTKFQSFGDFFLVFIKRWSMSLLLEHRIRLRDWDLDRRKVPKWLEKKYFHQFLFAQAPKRLSKYKTYFSWICVIVWKKY